MTLPGLAPRLARVAARSLAAWSFGLVALAPAVAGAESVFRLVPQANLAIIDPVWTTGVATRLHAYMIYDTLFGLDAAQKVQPQMVDRWQVSDDRRTWTFVLRENLAFHDGVPVTSDDVVASIARWSKRDILGQRLAAQTDAMEAVDPRTFRIRLKAPWGLMLEALASPSSAPFVMPKRVAETPAEKQIEDATGSGPFVFRRDLFKPGEKVVYERNPRYVPRAETPSGTAGGKLAKVDRVEWVILREPQTQVNALVKGEVDAIEVPAVESLPELRASKDVALLENFVPFAQFALRFNHLQPPFDDPKVRQAAVAALRQETFLKAQIGQPEWYRECFSYYPCKGPLFTSAGMEPLAKADVKRAQQLLKESGYDGTPVVILQPTDLAVLAKLPMVAAQSLRQAGFKVDLQSMDWSTLLARRVKKDPAQQGGWSVLATAWPGATYVDPMVNFGLAASCEKAWPGWPCDPELEKLRDAYAATDNPAERKTLAEKIQVRAMETVTYVPLGEFGSPPAVRRELKGFVPGYYFHAWNVERVGP